MGIRRCENRPSDGALARTSFRHGGTTLPPGGARPKRRTPASAAGRLQCWLVHARCRPRPGPRGRTARGQRWMSEAGRVVGIEQAAGAEVGKPAPLQSFALVCCVDPQTIALLRRFLPECLSKCREPTTGREFHFGKRHGPAAGLLPSPKIGNTLVRFGRVRSQNFLNCQARMTMRLAFAPERAHRALSNHARNDKAFAASQIRRAVNRCGNSPAGRISHSRNRKCPPRHQTHEPYGSAKWHARCRVEEASAARAGAGRQRRIGIKCPSIL